MISIILYVFLCEQAPAQDLVGQRQAFVEGLRLGLQYPLKPGQSHGFQAKQGRQTTTQDQWLLKEDERLEDLDIIMRGKYKTKEI